MTSIKSRTEKSFNFRFPTVFEYSIGQRYAKLKNECRQYYSKNKVFINNGDTFNGKYIIKYFKKTQNIEEFVVNNNRSTHNNSLKKIGNHTRELLKIVDEATLTKNINIISSIKFLTKQKYEEFLDQYSNVKKINYLKNNFNEFAMSSKSNFMPIQHSKLKFERNNFYFKIMTSLYDKQFNEIKHMKNCEIIKKQEIPFKLMQCSVVIFDITNYSEYELHQARMSFNYIFNELIKYNDEEILKSKKNGIIRKFILISTAMTWVKKNNHQTGEEQESDFVTTQESILERLPLTKYQNIFEFEKLMLKSNSSKIKDIFKTYIIGTGITYGHEESAFHHVFKSALINPKEIFISILNHRVPMFHIDELAKLVFIISKYDDRVRGNYVLAIEQKSYGFNNIIKSLCNESCSSHLVLKEDHLIIRKYKFDDFTWDLICSDLIIDPMLDIIIPDYHIRRTSIVSNMKESISEFVEANNFYLIKLIVSGQVQHVVNDIAKILAQYYQVKLVNVPDLINNYLTMLRTNQNEFELKINDFYEKRKNIIHSLNNFIDQFKNESFEQINEAFKIKKYSSTEKIMEDSNQTFAVRETSGISIKTKSTELEYTDYFQEGTNEQYIQIKNDLFEVEKDIINIQHMIKNLKDKYDEYENNMSRNQGELDYHFLLPLIKESLSSCHNQGYVLDIFPLSYEQIEFIFDNVIENPNFIILLSTNTSISTTIKKNCTSIHNIYEYQVKNMHVNHKTTSRYEVTTTNYIRDYFMDKNVKILKLDVPLELTTGKMTDLQYNHYMNSITTQIGHTHNKIDLQEIIKNLRQKTITNTLKKSNTIFNKLKIMKEQWENNIIANQKSKEKQENRMSVNTRTYLRLNFLPVLMKEICLIDNGAI
jgi:hypothetical protein